MSKQGTEAGAYRVKKPPFTRLATMEAFDAILPGHHMTALLEFDVTDTRRALRNRRREGRSASLFSFIIKAAATALDENREFNSIRKGRRIVEFEDVDINIPIENNTKSEAFPHQIVIRDASGKGAEEIYAEIEQARAEYARRESTGEEDRWAMSFMKILLYMPKFMRNVILRKAMNNPFAVKRMSGTTFVTSVGTFGKIPGFAIPYIGGNRAVSFAVGNVVEKPAVFKGEITVREFLSMTIVFNHDIVDGAPAARFISRLKKLIETPPDGRG
jgi:pyruvate/2-oxoglutarate dehydrogenase complex dihydrolipoamide acyltransferase (E2) component